jgi:hypothetical protein
LLRNSPNDFFVKDSLQSSARKTGFAGGPARIFWRVKDPSKKHSVIFKKHTVFFKKHKQEISKTQYDFSKTHCVFLDGYS